MHWSEPRSRVKETISFSMCSSKLSKRNCWEGVNRKLLTYVDNLLRGILISFYGVTTAVFQFRETFRNSLEFHKRSNKSRKRFLASRGETLTSRCRLIELHVWIQFQSENWTAEKLFSSIFGSILVLKLCSWGQPPFYRIFWSSKSF